jgi:hypothetical protein
MSRSSRRWPVVALIAAVLGVLVAPSGAQGADAPATRLGVAHGQQSLNPWNPRPAVVSGANVLAATPGTLQAQAIMGWGAVNPQPSPGVYDWSSLDRRVALIRATKGIPVITLCCSPDWMKGGSAGTTNWANLEVAPKREHYRDFAALAAAVARRYPDVKHFQVWNEMKGFWDTARNKWRYEDYTDLYNEVFRALKAVNPAIKVGGPYVSMTSWKVNVGGGRNSSVRGPWGMVDQRALDVVTYWLEHAVGADFIAVDGPASLKDGTFLTSPADSAAKFAAVNQWLRARTSLPIWWSEIYPIPYGASGRYEPAEEAALWTSTMRTLTASGASAAFLWQPEGVPGVTGLWSSTSSASGGQPTALSAALRPWLR